MAHARAHAGHGRCDNIRALLMLPKDSQVEVQKSFQGGHGSRHGAAVQMYDASLVRMRGTAAATNFALAGYRTELADFLNVQLVTLVLASLPCLACISFVHDSR